MTHNQYKTSVEGKQPCPFVHWFRCKALRNAVKYLNFRHCVVCLCMLSPEEFNECVRDSST